MKPDEGLTGAYGTRGFHDAVYLPPLITPRTVQEFAGGEINKKDRAAVMGSGPAFLRVCRAWHSSSG